MNAGVNPWTILSSKEEYDNPWINVTEYQVLNPSGGRGIYGKVHFKNKAIGVLPLDKDLNIYLVGQYRFSVEQYCWEIPEGGCPESSEPLDSAIRELAEETGLVAHSWEKLLEMHLSNSVSDELAILFLARDLEQHQPSPEETEQLTVKKIPFEEAYKMVEEGQITDSITVAGTPENKINDS